MFSVSRAFAKAGAKALIPLAGAAAIGGVLLVQALDSSPPSSTTAETRSQANVADDFIKKLAQNLGIDEQKLRDAIKKTALDEIDAAEAGGKLTKAQADKIRNAINSGTFPNFGIGELGHKGGPGVGRDDYRGASSPTDIAQFLGVDQTTLMNELKGGKTLAQVAQDHGKTRDDLKGFLVKRYDDMIDQAVKDGRFDSTKADPLKKNYAATVDKVIDSAMPFGGIPGGKMPHGGGTSRTSPGGSSRMGGPGLN